MACKHRIRILRGDSEGVISQNVAEVAIVASWLAGTDVDVAMKQLLEAEMRLEQAKHDVSAFKHKLARTLLD